MKLSSKALSSLVLFALISAPLIGTVIAPSGTGVLSDVQHWIGSAWQSVSPDPQGSFPVNPGETYRVIITNVEGEISSPTTVWIKGSDTNGDPWQIVLTDQPIVSGTITTEGFVIPSNAGCTALVAYDEVSHMAAETLNSKKPGHLKTYYVGGGPIPCEGTPVPELSAGPEVVTAIGLLAASVFVRKRRT